MLLTIRNLAVDYRNLQPIQETGLADLLQTIFDMNIDREVNRNIIDIFSSLTNVGLDFTKTIQYIEDYLEKEKIDDLETGIDLLKTLVE